jgi:hypothetical protein
MKDIENKHRKKQVKYIMKFSNIFGFIGLIVGIMILVCYLTSFGCKSKLKINSVIIGFGYLCYYCICLTFYIIFNFCKNTNKSLKLMRIIIPVIYFCFMLFFLILAISSHVEFNDYEEENEFCNLLHIYLKIWIFTQYALWIIFVIPGLIIVYKNKIPII